MPPPPTSTLFPYTTLFRSHPLATRPRLLSLSCAPSESKCRAQRQGSSFPRIRALLFCASSPPGTRSEEHTSELQSRENLVCRLLLEKKNTTHYTHKQNGAH